MSDFMQPQIIQAHFQVINNTNEGDLCFPESDSQYPSNEDAAKAYNVSLDDVETVFGYGCCLSAPGYMDQTEWSVFETEQECKDHLSEMYDVQFEEDN